MADGGEGTVQSLVDATGGQIVKSEVSGPMGNSVLASYGLLGDGKTAVIEMAEASGLPLVPKEQRDPLVATTYGTGELIADAIKRGVNEIILGIGGSATNDAGAGLAQALGVRFLNFGGAPIRDLISGGDLDDVQAVDMSSVNPGLGHSHQRRLRRDQSTVRRERRFARLWPAEGRDARDGRAARQESCALRPYHQTQHRGRRHRRPGRGGGRRHRRRAHGIYEFDLKRGVELVVAATPLEDHMQGAALAFTGEGRVDAQTAFGKTPSGVAVAARKHGVPVVAIGGGLADDAGGVFAHGIDGLEFATPNAMPLDVAIKKSRQYLQDAAERAARLDRYRPADAQVDAVRFM